MDEWTESTKEKFREEIKEDNDLKIKLSKGIKLRLKEVEPFLQVWPAAMALGLSPCHWHGTAKRLHNISSTIWHEVGDQDLSMSWYTKRSLLTGAYVSSELFMV